MKINIVVDQLVFENCTPDQAAARANAVALEIGQQIARQSTPSLLAARHIVVPAASEQAPLSNWSAQVASSIVRNAQQQG